MISKISASPKLLIVSNYGLNTGDVGILTGLVSAIRARCSDTRITIETSHPDYLSTLREFSSLELFPRIFDIQDYRGDGDRVATARIILVGAYDTATFLLWATLRRIGPDLPWLVRRGRRAQVEAWEGTDIVVSTGGGFLSTYYRYALHLIPYVLGLLLDKKMVILGQSIGPFETRLSRLLVPPVLARFDAIAIREPNSLAYLERFVFANRPILTADLAFLMDPSMPPDIAALKDDRKVVAIVVKPYADPAQRDAFAAAVSGVIRSLIGGGYGCVLVSHFPSGDGYVDAIAERTGVPVEKVKFGPDPRAMKALYGKCAFIISGLMHPTIFAASEGVPFVVIGYEPKFEGLMDMLSYDRELFFTDKDLMRPSFGEALQTAVDRVIARREMVSGGLLAKMPSVRVAALKNIDLLEDFLIQRSI